MITSEFARIMARYNRWQNRSLVSAANMLTDADRWQDRGSFFRSIAETLNHVLWDDRIWLARLRGDETTAKEIGARHPYTDAPRDWSKFSLHRVALDAAIITWAVGLTESDLAQTVSWTRGDRVVETGYGFNVIHMMNHATHHRGQVHAMLTAAGSYPEATDLQMLPDLGERHQWEGRMPAKDNGTSSV